MKKKLAIIGLRGYPADFPGSSGIDTYIENILPYLKNDFQINLYTRSWVKSKKIKTDNPQVTAIPTAKHYLLDTAVYSLIAPVAALIQGNDIFWFHAPGSCFLMPLVFFCGKKIIFTSHGIDWQRDKWKSKLIKLYLKLLEYISIKYSHFQTAVSEDIVDYLNSTYSIRSTFLPPGRAAGCPSILPPRHLLFLGRLTPEKRIHWLIKAYQHLPYHLQNKWPLIIAGDPGFNPGYFHQLKTLSGRNPSIKFVGHISRYKKEAALTAAKLFILPSNLEGNSLALNEAINHHLICLAADLPVHQKINLIYPDLYLFRSNSYSDFFQKFKLALSRQPSPSFQSPYPPWPKVAQTVIRILSSQ